MISISFRIYIGMLMPLLTAVVLVELIFAIKEIAAGSSSLTLRYWIMEACLWCYPCTPHYCLGCWGGIWTKEQFWYWISLILKDNIDFTLLHSAGQLFCKIYCIWPHTYCQAQLQLQLQLQLQSWDGINFVASDHPPTTTPPTHPPTRPPGLVVITVISQLLLTQFW